jgi:hypothetical protein
LLQSASTNYTTAFYVKWVVIINVTLDDKFLKIIINERGMLKISHIRSTVLRMSYDHSVYIVRYARKLSALRLYNDGIVNEYKAVNE